MMRITSSDDSKGRDFGITPMMKACNIPSLEIPWISMNCMCKYVDFNNYNIFVHGLNAWISLEIIMCKWMYTEI